MSVPALDPDRWHVVSPYLDQALDLADEERTAWLTALRVQDPTLAAEVAALLEDRRAASREGFLENRAPPRLPSLAGQTLGAYTLVSLVGQGGMGSVWLARRSDGRFEGQAAVKLLNASLIGQAGEERLRREGSFLARLRHPHIAQLIDSGLSPLGQPYLVLEHVDGERIDAYCDARSLGVEARIQLFIDVLAAVAHAHAKLIVHRDLKPSNVLVGRDGQVKLLDFGIAKLLESETQDATALTREGTAVLTPEYAAPEQVTGGDITTATDVYALGLLLYVLLAGRHPAAGALHSPADLLRAIMETDPPPLSDAVSLTQTAPLETLTQSAARRASTPERLRRVLAGDLDTIVAKALKKNPQERYASVTALADDLHRYLSHEPISARPDRLAYRAAKFVRRHRTPVALTSVLILALVGGLTGTLSQAREAARQRDLALVQLARAEGINEFSGYLLGEAAPGGQAVTMLELLKRAERMVDRRYARDEALGVDLLVNIADVYDVLEDTANSERLMRRAYETSLRLGDPGVRANATCGWARVVAQSGNYAEAQRLFDQALGLVTSEARFDHMAAGCLVDRAYIASISGDTAATLEGAQMALERLGRRPGAFTETRSSALHVLALAHDMLGETGRAERAFEAAMQELERIGHAGTNSAAILLNNWALTRTATDVQGALALQEQAMEAVKAEEGSDAVSPAYLANYGRLLQRLARYPEAAAAFEKARETARRHENEHNIGTTSLGLARARRSLGDLGAAEPALLEAGRALRASVPAGHHFLADLAREEGLFAAARGDGEGARRLLSQALVVHEAASERNVSHIETLLELATLELRDGRRSEAAKHTRRALELAEGLRDKSPHSAWVGLALAGRAQIELSEADAPAARRSLEESLAHLVPTFGEGHPAVRDVRERLLNIH